MGGIQQSLPITLWVVQRKNIDLTKGVFRIRNQKGFSPVDLLIVVAIIGIIAAIAIPSLLSARRAANESAAIGSLRAFGSAEATALSLNGTYQDIGTMAGNKYIDAQWSNGSVRDNYTFADLNATNATFGLSAVYQTGGGTRSFAVYGDYVIRTNPAQSAPGPTDAPVGTVASS